MKKISLKIKAVIFDMDGVITNTMPDHYRAWNDVLGHAKIHVTHHDVYSHEGQTGIGFLRDIFLKNNLIYDEKKARAILKKKEELFKKIVKTRFIIEARSFLRYLHERKLKLALVTGTARHELHRILPGHLYDLFEVVVTASEVKNGKPHPEPYNLALKKLKCNKKDAVVIENAPFGIQSAHGAGLRCLAIETSLPAKYLTEAEYIFKSIKNLREKVNFIPSF